MKPKPQLQLSSFDLFLVINTQIWISIYQGGHKPEKHGKPGKHREFEKMSKSQEKLREI